MLDPQMPLAVNWGELIIFLFIVGTSLIGKMLQASQERRARQKKQQRRGLDDTVRGPENRPGQQPSRPPADPPHVARAEPKEKLEQEIEAFLRRGQEGAQRPGGRQPQGQPMPRQAEASTGAPPPLVQPGPSGRQRVGGRPPAGGRTRWPEREDVHLPEPMGAQRAEQEARRQRDEGDALRPRSDQLAQGIESSDERLEGHLHTVFDHKVGSLDEGFAKIAQGTDAAVWEQSAMQQATMADRLFQMLSSPDQVGAAIVVSEIIRRPEERWQNDPF